MSALLQFSQFVQKTFALWVLLFSGIALMIPETFVWLRAYIPWMLGIIMFGMGMTFSTVQAVSAATRDCHRGNLGGLLSGWNRIQCDYLYGQGQYRLVCRLYFSFYVIGAHSNSGHFLLVGQSVD